MAHAVELRHSLADTASVAVQAEPDFDFCGRDYAELFERSGATAFQHPLWLDAHGRHLAPARGATSIAVTGREPASGRLRFVLPLILRRKSGVTLLEAADLGVSDYAAPVVERGWTAPAGLAELVEANLPAYDLMRIRPIRQELVAAWSCFFEAESRPLDFCAHATELTSSYPAWRAGALDPSFARYLDRKKKRFFKLPGARLQLLSDDKEIADAIEAIRRLRAGRFEGDMIEAEPVRDFYREVAVRGAASGLTRTYALVTQDEAVGYVFGLAWRGRFHYLLIGCDYAAHGRHSPGLILYDAIMEDWVATGGTVFDFTIGDEAFKQDFATRPTPMHALVRATTWRGRLAAAAVDAREQLRNARTGDAS